MYIKGILNSKYLEKLVSWKSNYKETSNNMGKRIKNSRVLTFALVAMLVFLVVFSEYFIHREAMHECHDEVCPICIVINQSNNILSSLLRSNFLSSIVLVLLFYVIKLFNYNQNVFTYSLVENNVRLNE